MFIKQKKNSPGSLYTSWKSPATIEKSESAGRLCGLTSGKDTGLVWSEDILLLLNWWIQGYRVKAFSSSHLRDKSYQLVSSLLQMLYRCSIQICFPRTQRSSTRDTSSSILYLMPLN